MPDRKKPRGLGTPHPKLRELNCELARLAFRIWRRDHRKVNRDSLLFELWSNLAERDRVLRETSGQRESQVEWDRGFAREEFDRWREVEDEIGS